MRRRRVRRMRRGLRKYGGKGWGSSPTPSGIRRSRKTKFSNWVFLCQNPDRPTPALPCSPFQPRKRWSQVLFREVSLRMAGEDGAGRSQWSGQDTLLSILLGESESDEERSNGNGHWLAPPSESAPTGRKPCSSSPPRSAQLEALALPGPDPESRNGLRLKKNLPNSTGSR